MRPRVFPAEDSLGPMPHLGDPAASMRPRVFPAEDPGGTPVLGWLLRASMRPRVFPAEDQSGPRLRRQCQCRFNEAAGIPRGRRPRQGEHSDDDSASMRPRVFPAEDSGAWGAKVTGTVLQ